MVSLFSPDGTVLEDVVDRLFCFFAIAECRVHDASSLQVRSQATVSCSQPDYSFLFMFVCLFVGCLTSQQHASVSQGRICTDNFTCCHTEIEVADQTFHLTQSQYTDTGPTSPSADPITPGAWQGSHWSANF